MADARCLVDTNGWGVLLLIYSKLTVSGSTEPLGVLCMGENARQTGVKTGKAWSFFYGKLLELRPLDYPYLSMK